MSGRLINGNQKYVTFDNTGGAGVSGGTEATPSALGLHRLPAGFER